MWEETIGPGENLHGHRQRYWSQGDHTRCPGGSRCPHRAAFIVFIMIAPYYEWPFVISPYLLLRPFNLRGVRC